MPERQGDIARIHLCILFTFLLSFVHFASPLAFRRWLPSYCWWYSDLFHLFKLINELDHTKRCFVFKDLPSVSSGYSITFHGYPLLDEPGNPPFVDGTPRGSLENLMILDFQVSIYQRVAEYHQLVNYHRKSLLSSNKITINEPIKYQVIIINKNHLFTTNSRSTNHQLI